ncbi:MAG TPA: PH domain-containing protein [Chthoniobacterales bacterium]|nr:PH domain-containing protein [Chthoniobacterales bacterium]
MKSYKAPWSISLIVLSSIATLVCIGVAVGVLSTGRERPIWAAMLPLAIIAGSALFTIRGYTVTGDAVLIHRLFWTTRLPLAGLQSAQFEPDAMARSLRTFGNGGLFSFTGFYWNKMLGAYRAFVTDPHRTVVLRFAARKVVVSPSAPDDFVQQIAAAS